MSDDIVDRSTPTMAHAIQIGVQRELMDVHTAIPAKIVSYDFTTNLAKVLPLLKRKYKADSASVQLPIISNVPVSFPRTVKSHLRFPLAAEDTGFIICMERSIDLWLQKGGIVDPLDSRVFSLSDAVFVPGIFDKTKPMKSVSPAAAVEMKNDEMFVDLRKDGKIRIGNPRNELLKTLVQLCDDLINALILTGIGQQPFIEVTRKTFEERKKELEDLKV